MTLSGVVTGGVQIVGLRRLRQTMKKAGEDMADFRDANRRVAAIVKPVAQATAPLGPPPHGHIRATVRASGTITAVVIRAGNNSTFPYANPIHWGWVRRGIRPNPWVSRAAQDTEPAWLPVYFSDIEAALRKVEGA